LEDRLADARPLRSLSDDELLKRLAGFVGQSRRTEADLIAHLAEVDERRLYAREASPSMFAYCTDVLHLSEHEAYLRITIARASRKHPRLLSMLADGRLHLSGAAELAPLLSGLSPQERGALLERATHKSKREIQGLVAAIAPRPEVAAQIRKLPDRALAAAPVPSVAPLTGVAPLTAPVAPGTPQPERPEPARAAELVFRAPVPVRRDTVAPIAPSRYLVQFTASAELRAKLERLKALRPGVELADLIEQAVSEKLERLESRRFGLAKAPRKGAPVGEPSSSRYIPASVRRAVYKRDGGRCRYEDDSGRRCPATRDLEFDHFGIPWARGGEHTVANLRLLCPTHNALEAERDYGTEKVSRLRLGRRASGFQQSSRQGTIPAS
jgi:5-methylcytosine-specific restriction endonuclease McrA